METFNLCLVSLPVQQMGSQTEDGTTAGGFSDGGSFAGSSGAQNCRSLKVAESRLWLREQCEIWFMISSKTLFHDKLIGFHPNYGLWKYNLPF